MGNYIAGPSVLRLTGRVQAVVPGEAFAHDFSQAGPEGPDGPGREAVLLASGAATLQPGEITEFDRIAAASAAADRAAQAATRISVEDALRDTTDAAGSALTREPTARPTDDLSAARPSRRRTSTTDPKES